MPPLVQFYKKITRGGKCSSASTHQWCSSSPCLPVLVLMPLVLSIAPHVPGKAQPGALQGWAQQAQSIWKLQLMEQEEDCALTLTPRERGRFVPLRGAAQERKGSSKSWDFSLVRRQSYNFWACFGKIIPHRLLSCSEGPERQQEPQSPADFKGQASNPAPPWVFRGQVGTGDSSTPLGPVMA